MPSFATLDMEGVALRLAGIEATREAPVCALDSPAPQAAPDTATPAHPTPLPVAEAAGAVAAAAAADVVMQHRGLQADAADRAAMKEELEAAIIRAQAQQVRVRCSYS